MLSLFPLCEEGTGEAKSGSVANAAGLWWSQNFTTRLSGPRDLTSAVFACDS